jgi:hypothetical protein
MTSEATVQTAIRVALPQLTNGHCWRNNRGAHQDETGRWVRYGLANESKQEGDVIKSSDLIGCVPEMVWIDRTKEWRTVAVLTAIEVKPSYWSFPSPTNKAEYARCLAQQRFIDIVREAGGYAGFATSVDDMRRIIGR